MLPIFNSYKQFWATVSLTALVVPFVMLTPTKALAAPTINSQDKAQVQQAWQRYEQLAGIQPNWTGNLDTCTPGTTSKEYQDAMQETVNIIRGIAGLNPVTFDPALNANAQAAALIMAKNRGLTHSPQPTAGCYTEAGDLGARRSNLHSGYGGPAALISYMHDDGANNAPVGHRRWILHPQITTMGTGDVNRYNALYVQGKQNPFAQHVATQWPSQGYFPESWIPQRWSYTASHKQADFTNATVTVTNAQGKTLPITIQHRSKGYSYAYPTIVWSFSGEKPTVVANQDTIVNVSVQGITTPNGTVNDSYQVKLYTSRQDINVSVDRIQGPSRFETAELISQKFYSTGSRPVVYIATAFNHADALAGGLAAGREKGPMLLTQPNTLHPAAMRELQRLKPSKIVILGGGKAINANVENQLRTYTTGEVKRIAGPNRFITAQALSQYVFTQADTLYLASESGVEFALEAANLFYTKPGPMLFIPNNAKSVPDYISSELKRLQVKTIHTEFIDKAVIDQLKAAGYTVEVGLPGIFDLPVRGYPNGAKTMFMVSTAGGAADGLAISPSVANGAGPVAVVLSEQGLHNMRTVHDGLTKLGVTNITALGGVLKGHSSLVFKPTIK